MASLTNDVLSAVIKGKSRAPEISKFIFGNINSVRSALARLTQRGEIIRVRRGSYAPPSSTFLYEHYLADTHYNRGIGVIMYTEEETEEEEILIEALQKVMRDADLGFILSFGYSRERVPNTGQELDTVDIVGIDF